MKLTLNKSESGDGDEGKENITETNIDPKNWPKRKKYLILFIVSLAGLIGPASSMYVNPIF